MKLGGKIVVLHHHVKLLWKLKQDKKRGTENEK